MNLLKLLLSLFLVFGMYGCQNSNAVYDETTESVTVFITIMDETTETELFSGEISGSGYDLTLEDVLLDNEKTLQLVSEKSTYGMRINGLMGIETTDWHAGPWWMYSSENNASCVAAGYCEGASKLKVANGDEFTFTFSTGY